MNDAANDDSWPDPQMLENWRSFPADERAKYAGLYIAFSPDATRIIASGPTQQAVDQQLRDLGIHPGRVIQGYVDPPE